MFLNTSLRPIQDLYFSGVPGRCAEIVAVSPPSLDPPPFTPQWSFGDPLRVPNYGCGGLSGLFFLSQW